MLRTQRDAPALCHAIYLIVAVRLRHRAEGELPFVCLRLIVAYTSAHYRALCPYGFALRLPARRELIVV